MLHEIKMKKSNTKKRLTDLKVSKRGDKKYIRNLTSAFDEWVDSNSYSKAILKTAEALAVSEVQKLQMLSLALLEKLDEIQNSERISLDKLVDKTDLRFTESGLYIENCPKCKAIVQISWWNSNINQDGED